MARIIEQKNPSSGSVKLCYLFVTSGLDFCGFVFHEILKKWAVSDLQRREKTENFKAEQNEKLSPGVFPCFCLTEFITPLRRSAPVSFRSTKGCVTKNCVLHQNMIHSGSTIAYGVKNVFDSVVSKSFELYNPCKH